MTELGWVKKALDQHEVPLLRYAVSILGDLDRARDVVQETFLRLCRQKREAVEGHLAPWLFRVCRNRALDLQRRRNRMKATTVDELRRLPDRAPDPSQVLERKESADHVRELLESLSENQREVLRLKFQAGMSYREISEVTGLSESNVGFLIHTAVKNLRGRIADLTPARPVVRRIK